MHSNHLILCHPLSSCLQSFPASGSFPVSQLFAAGGQTTSSVQSLSQVRLFATPWAAAFQASLSITNSWSLLKLKPIELVMPSNHLILCQSAVWLSKNWQKWTELDRFIHSSEHLMSASCVSGINLDAWDVWWTKHSKIPPIWSFCSEQTINSKYNE